MCVALRRFLPRDNEKPASFSQWRMKSSHVTQRHRARARWKISSAARAAYPRVGARWFHLLAISQPTGRQAAAFIRYSAERAVEMMLHPANEQEADRIGIQVLQRADLTHRRCPFPRKTARPCALPTRPPEICSLTPYRKAAQWMPATVPTRCARSWCNLPPTSIRQSARPECTIPT